MNIKKNYIYSLVYQILIIIIPFVTAPYISRVLGADGIGIVSYNNSIAQYFVMFGMLGIINYGNRTIASLRDDKKEYSKAFWNIYVIQLILSLISLVGYIAYLTLAKDLNLQIAKIQLIFVVSALFDINWFFFGLEKFKLTVTRSILIRIITLILTFTLVKNREDLWVYALIGSSGIFISQILLWGKLKKNIIFVKPKFIDIIPHIKPIIILFVPVITISLYKIFDKIMIGLLSTMTQVGFYENSEKIIKIPMGMIIALGTVMMPRLSNSYANNDMKKSKEYIRNSMQFSMFLAFGMTFGLCLVSDTFAPLYFGQNFAETSPIISVLSITIIFISWANIIRALYLIPRKKEKIYIFSVLIGAAVNIILNIFLIPKYGALGAAVGTLIAEIIVTVSQTFLSRNDLELSSYIKDSLPYFVSGLLMFIIVPLVLSVDSQSVSYLIKQITLGGLIYIVLVVFLSIVFDKNRFSFLIKSVFNKI